MHLKDAEDTHSEALLLCLVVLDCLAALLDDGQHPPVQELTHNSSVRLCFMLHLGIEAQHGSDARRLQQVTTFLRVCGDWQGSQDLVHQLSNGQVGEC